MKLTFYMKSGNTIEQRGVKEWEIRANQETGKVTYLCLYYQKGLFAPRKRIIVTSLVLSEIEAIVQG